MSPQISTPIHFENELKERKAQVIERIKDVRTAQRAFRAEYQRYAEDFDELERFLHANPTELRCDIEQLLLHSQFRQRVYLGNRIYQDIL